MSYDGTPVFVVDDISDPWQYDFGNDETLIDIYQAIITYDVITR